MSPRIPLAHRLATVLLKHAATVLPVERETWFRAMEAECQSISHHGEALRWSLGCVRAAYAEYAARARPFARPVVRVTIAIVVLWQAHGAAFTAALAYMYNFNPPVALRYLTPDRVAMYAAIPMSLTMIFAASALLYTTAAVCLVRSRATTLRWYMAGVALNFTALAGLSWVSDPLSLWPAARQHVAYMTLFGYAALGLMFWRKHQVGEPSTSE